MKVTIEKIDIFYGNILFNLIESLYKDPLETFVPNLSQRWNYGPETKKLLNKLCNLIVPKVSEKYYSSAPIKIIDTKFLRHLKDSDDKGGAFDWHSDNHPPDILNIVVYLSSVEEDGGGMEWIEVNGEVMSRPFTNPPGNHNLEYAVNHLSNESTFQIKKMIGKSGTSFIFDNCIFHRATKVSGKHRDALLLQVEPK